MGRAGGEARGDADQSETIVMILFRGKLLFVPGLFKPTPGSSQGKWDFLLPCVGGRVRRGGGTEGGQNLSLGIRNSRPPPPHRSSPYPPTMQSQQS